MAKKISCPALAYLTKNYKIFNISEIARRAGIPAQEMYNHIYQQKPFDPRTSVNIFKVLTKL